MINVTATPEIAPEPVKVLVAEDEVLVRLMVAEVLREAGFRGLEAANADEAIAILKKMQVTRCNIEGESPLQGKDIRSEVLPTRNARVEFFYP